MRQKLNLITLGVNDFDRSIGFFEKGLGWKKSSASVEELALFALGGIVLALPPRRDLAADVTISPEGSEFSGITLSYNAKSETEVDEVHEKVRGQRTSVVKPAQKVYWGGYSGYFKDLDGHLFKVAHNPFWDLDEKDNFKLP